VILGVVLMKISKGLLPIMRLGQIVFVSVMRVVVPNGQVVPIVSFDDLVVQGKVGLR
jgi:hypothetical protein